MPRNSPPNSSETTHWQKSSHAGLVKYLPTGGYYARFRSSGKLLWRSLKTKVLSIAVQRLGDLKREQNATKRHRTRITEGTLTMADAAARVLASMEANRSLKPRTKAYYGEILKKMVSVWPNWNATPVTKVTKVDCMEWSARMAGCSPSVFNHAVGLLRKTLNIGVENGAIYLNHANSIPKARITQRRLILPSFDEFNRFVLAIESSGSGWSQPCADLVRFLAYGGFRRSEAAQISWSDVDQEKGTIHVHGDPQHGTKSGKARQVPIIPEMGTLLQRLESLRHHGEPTDRVMQVRECQKAMERAAAEVGMVRITHHDLRHLFV